MNKKNLNNYSTTVLFTDIVGYSSLFSKNEQKAMNLLKKHDEVIVPIIDENDGKIIKNIGDSFFVKYEDSINAIKSALEIQKQIFARNEIKNEKDQFKIRIGIHSGEIIEKNNEFQF